MLLWFSFSTDYRLTILLVNLVVVYLGEGIVPCPPWRSLIQEIRDRFKVKTFFYHLKIFPLIIFDCDCMSPPFKNLRYASELECGNSLVA